MDEIHPLTARQILLREGVDTSGDDTPEPEILRQMVVAGKISLEQTGQIQPVSESE